MSIPEHGPGSTKSPEDTSRSGICIDSMITRVASFIAAFLVSFWFVRELGPSQYPQIVIWSGIRVVFLVLLLACACYLFTSVFKPRLARVNGYIFFLLLVDGLGLEIILRARPSLIPAALHTELPSEARRRLGNMRGAYTEDSVTGVGTLFYYKPHLRLPEYPHVRIDQDGHRNSVDNIRSAEVVLVGDSMTMALAADKDMGELFRDDGHTALNIAMGAYTPLHYRDAYKKWVVEAGVGHKVVLTFLAVVNDFSADVTNYADMVARGGDYRMYLSSGTAGRSLDHYPWVFALGRALPAYVAYQYYDRPHTINLPYKRVTVSNFLAGPVSMRESSVEWPYIRDAVDDTIAMARQSGARPFFFLVPAPVTLYSKFAPELAHFDRAHAILSATLARHFEAKGVEFVDLNEALRREIETHFIFSSDSDVHFNTAGVEAAYRTVRATVFGK